MEGISSWHFDKPEELADLVEMLPVKPGNTTISFNFPEYLLYPDPFTRSEAEQMFLQLHGRGEGQMIVSKRGEGEGAVNILQRIPSRVYEYISGNFPGATTRSSLLCNFPEEINNSISIVFYEKNFHVQVCGSELKLLSRNGYSSPGEVVYLLLHACNVYGLDPSGCNLYLSGLIDENSKLYNELYRFFLNISFAGQGRGRAVPGFDAHPVHYFDHYHSLYACGS